MEQRWWRRFPAEGLQGIYGWLVECEAWSAEERVSDLLGLEDWDNFEEVTLQESG